MSPVHKPFLAGLICVCGSLLHAGRVPHALRALAHCHIPGLRTTPKKGGGGIQRLRLRFI